MRINLINNYDKYGFALKSVSRTFLEEWREAHIEIKYITKDKTKNINSYGYAFKDLRYAIPTDNTKETINEIYNCLNNTDIITGTKYLLLKYPNKIDNIVHDIPSFAFAETEFLNFLLNTINALPENKKTKANATLAQRLKGIKSFINNHKSNNSKSL